MIRREFIRDVVHMILAIVLTVLLSAVGSKLADSSEEIDGRDLASFGLRAELARSVGHDRSDRARDSRRSAEAIGVNTSLNK